jgi:adenylosuccinate synthase
VRVPLPGIHPSATVAVRVGGSNSGHTVIDKSGIPRVFRVLPTPALLDDVVCVLGAGSYIDVDVLLDELKVAQLPPDRLLIDPNAFVITDDHKRIENQWRLREQIGSTGSGTGAAVVERVTRQSSAHLARHDPRLDQYTGRSTRSFLREALFCKERVVIEGTQGFGLSVLHSPYYPKATSRDTTAAGFVSEAGLSPLDVDQVVLVIRAFPIRVPGDSGHLSNEICPRCDRHEPAHNGGAEPRRLFRHLQSSNLGIKPSYSANLIGHAGPFEEDAHSILPRGRPYPNRSGRPTPTVSQAVCAMEAKLSRTIDLVGLGPNILVLRRTLADDIAS